MKQIANFFSQLISNDESKSSARFASLVALFVSSWIMIHVTINNPNLLESLFMFYVGTFALQYAVGKGISVFNANGRKENGQQ